MPVKHIVSANKIGCNCMSAIKQWYKFGYVESQGFDSKVSNVAYLLQEMYVYSYGTTCN